MLVSAFQHGQALQIIPVMDIPGINWESLTKNGSAELKISISNFTARSEPGPPHSHFGCGASSKICWVREQKWDLGVSSGEEHLGQGLFKVLQILNLYLELLSHPEGSAPTPGSLFSAFFFLPIPDGSCREGGR